jgi:hypothetical protein
MRMLLLVFVPSLLTLTLAATAAWIIIIQKAMIKPQTIATRDKGFKTVADTKALWGTRISYPHPSLFPNRVLFGG